jgi:Icc-related predicted phosphoesterase
MRILAAADIHGVPFVYEWLVGLSHSADLLILAGDLFDADFPAEQRKQAQRIIARLRESRVPVLYIMGNDDNIPLDHEDGLIQPLHARRVEIGGYNFVGYQYTPPFVGDMFVKADSEIAEDLRLLEPLMDERTVLVTHTPAFGCLDLCYEENVGSRSLAELLVRKPVLAHIHGHIHYWFGIDGNHFNVAAAATCRAMLIDLPSLQHEVLRYSESA